MMVWVEGVVESVCVGVRRRRRRRRRRRKGKGGQRFNFLADMFSWIGKVVVWRDETKPPCPHRKNWRRKRRKNRTRGTDHRQITDRSHAHRAGIGIDRKNVRGKEGKQGAGETVVGHGVAGRHFERPAPEH